MDRAKIRYISPENIIYDPGFNCRGEFTVQSVEELARNIEKTGRLLSPLTVQPYEGRYKLIAGHRRYKAITTFLKWSEIPCIVLEGLTDYDARLINLTENTERKDLNPLDEARALQNMPWEGGVMPDIRTVAKAIGKSTRWTHLRLRILELPTQIQGWIAERRLTLSDIEVVCRKYDDASRLKAAKEIIRLKAEQAPKFAFEEKRVAPSFKHRRKKKEITNLIQKLLDAGISGLPTRIAAWCAGYVSDTELDEDIKNHLHDQ